MPHISIRERYFPFSHTPGVSLLFPGSSLCFTIYPTVVSCRDLEGVGEHEIPLPVVGPVSGFTVVQDLERGAIRIFGTDQKGFFRFCCKREGDDLFLVQEKGGEARWPLPKPKLLFTPPHANERLSVVSLQHRSIERMVESGDYVEQLGTLYRFLTWYEPLEISYEGELHDLILGGFESLLVPTGKDTKKLGMAFSFDSPMIFLRGLRFLLTSLFVEAKEGVVSLCPELPKEIPAGRIKGLHIDGLTLDLEWRKGTLRRVALESSEEKTLYLKAKGLHSARVDKRKIDLEKPLQILPNQRHFIDRFEKA